MCDQDPDKFYIDMKVAEIFQSKEFLKDGSFRQMIDCEPIKEAMEELTFELVRQDVNNQPGSIRDKVENLVSLVMKSVEILVEQLTRDSYDI